MSGAGPDLTNLRVFGCPDYVHIESSRRKKLDPKAWKGIFVGYAVDSHVYLVYNPATKSVIRTHNVTFDETWLPAQRRSPNLGGNAPSGPVMENLSSSSPRSTNTPEIPAPPSSPASRLGETSGLGKTSGQGVRGYGIAFCGAMYGCSLMYLSLDPALCDTTVDECDC